jgi:4-hydroxybenzoyl-CoA thioesterase/acyl-CoA thioester hydrolase
MATSYQTSRRVEFSDTDTGGMMHFTAFFRFMEQAEHALLRELGTSVHGNDEQGTVSWPRVSASCDFTQAARFEDLLTITLQVARLGRSSVTYQCQFHRDGELLASGKIVSVCCRLVPGQAPRSMDIPPGLAEKLQQYQASDQDT